MSRNVREASFASAVGHEYCTIGVNRYAIISEIDVFECVVFLAAAGAVGFDHQFDTASIEMSLSGG